MKAESNDNVRGGSPRVVLCGGGTGGHVYPALAVAEELKRLRPEVQLLYIGGDRVESRLVPEAGLPFRGIRVHGMAGSGLSGIVRKLRAAIELPGALRQSRALLQQFGAQVVIGTGGYVTGPVIMAAHRLGIPAVALEGNRTPGFTSKMVSRYVQVMAVGWSELAPFFEERSKGKARVVVTGLPVRRELTQVSREQGAHALHFNPNLSTVLILGGSLGSEKVNGTVVEALRRLGSLDGRLRLVQVLHMTGQGRGPSLPQEEAEKIVPSYRAVEWVDIPQALAAADLVISRGGSSTVAEIGARGVPAIFLPWAAAATGEQELNVEPFVRAGAAVRIRDAELTPERLQDALADLLWNPEKLARMARASRLLGKPQAAETVAKLALELAGRS